MSRTSRPRRQKKRRSNKRRRTGRSRPSRPSAVAVNRSTLSLFVQCIRDLLLYCHTIEGTSSTKVDPSWLDHLRYYGCIGMRLFAMLFTVSLGAEPKKYYCPVGAVQSLLIGADDLMVNHAIVESEGAGTDGSVVHYLDFRQAFVRGITAYLSAGSRVEARAGRYCAVLMDLTEEEVDMYKPAAATGEWTNLDNWAFADVTQMPGSVTAPFGTPITISWKPTVNTFAVKYLRIGQQTGTKNPHTDPVRGGSPVARLVIGYQDFAAGEPAENNTPAYSYIPSNMAIQISLRGSITFREPGKSYIRTRPPWTQDPKNISVSTVQSSGREVAVVPHDTLYLDQGRICSTLDLKGIGEDLAQISLE